MRGAYNLVVVVSGTFGAAIDNTHTYATMWANEIERDEEPNIFVNAKLWYSCGHVPCRKVRRACSDSKQLRHLLTPMRRRHIHDSIGTQFHHFQAHEFAWIFFFFSICAMRHFDWNSNRAQQIDWDVFFVIWRTAVEHSSNESISDAV